MEPKTNAQIALEAAAKLYEGQGRSMSISFLLEKADSILDWLNERS